MLFVPCSLILRWSERRLWDGGFEGLVKRLPCNEEQAVGGSPVQTCHFNSAAISRYAARAASYSASAASQGGLPGFSLSREGINKEKSLAKQLGEPVEYAP
jgi:hypothetical protein